MRLQSVALRMCPRPRKWLGASALISLALAGCFNYSPDKMVLAPELVEPRLPPMQDGQSMRAGFEGRLGPPTMTLSNGRIVAYDLLLRVDEESIHKAMHDSGAKRRQWEELRRQWIIDKAPIMVLPRTLPDPETQKMQYDLAWSPEYILVLVFDGRDVLQRHRLWSITP